MVWWKFKLILRDMILMKYSSLCRISFLMPESKSLIKGPSSSNILQSFYYRTEVRVRNLESSVHELG